MERGLCSDLSAPEGFPAPGMLNGPAVRGISAFHPVQADGIIDGRQGAGCVSYRAGLFEGRVEP
jgi:hypothetical protein